jgi:hypothetical protein
MRYSDSHRRANELRPLLFVTTSFREGGGRCGQGVFPDEADR